MELVEEIIPNIDAQAFTNFIRRSKKLVKLFEIINCKEGISIKDASIKLFGDDSKQQALKQLRLRMHRSIIEFVLKNGANFKNVDNYTQQHRVLMNQVGVVKYLMSNNSQRTAAQIAESLIRTSVSNEFSDITLLASRELIYYYGHHNYNKIKYEKYERLLSVYSDLYMKEIEVTNQGYKMMRAAHTELGIKHNSWKQKWNPFIEKVNSYLKNEVISYELMFKSYNVLAVYYEQLGDYATLIEICDKAKSAFLRRKVARKVTIYNFDSYRIRVFIQLQEHNKAEKLIAKYIDSMTVGAVNWFSLQFYSIVNKLHKKEYFKAFEKFNVVKSNKNYLRQAEQMIQVWKICEAYIEFCISHINYNDSSTFRLNKFLNEVPIYTKDKRGLNIAILIIQVLFLLQQRKYSQIIDRAESLKLYCYRYLRKDDTFRSHCFIRMLLQMPKADFNRIRTERYAEPYLKKLQSVPLKISQQSIEVEVIPYEDLWGITLDLLD